MFKYHEESRDPLLKVLVPICVLEVGFSVGIAKIPRGVVSCFREHHVPTLENAEDELMYEIKANQQTD